MSEPPEGPVGRKMKTRAPPPPQPPQPAPRHIFRTTVPDGGRTSDVDAKENALRSTVHLQLTLPQGCQISLTEDGSKALMDLLVEVCSRYHLNPALHTLELLSPEGHPLGFKPNALLGSLNVACVLIKEKVWEEKVVRRPAPKVPEKTVRLMVNYHGTQKAVVRVNPLVPLQALIPVICEKCDFDPAHILLLKDSSSRHEIPLDKSLTELGIKELYVHDQRLDPICSSTFSLGSPEKKGFLGIFQFSKKKSKTETPSTEMDDKVIQNTNTQSNGLSKMSTVPSVEVRSSTLGQSHSATNIPRMSPQSDTKKRRAPVPPGAPSPIIGDTSFDTYQVGLGSESQQKKRKAPAPPPTPDSITPDSDSTSASATPTPDSHATETPTPVYRTKEAQSFPVSSAIVVTHAIQPVPNKTAVQPPHVCAARSPTPSSSTTDSVTVQDSSSDDSDAHLEQAGSHCSTLTSSTASDCVRVQPTTKSSSRMVELGGSSGLAAKLNEETTPASNSRSDAESALNLKLDEADNRHSAVETAYQQAPPKPRRSPAREPPQLALPSTPSTPPLSSSPTEPTESSSPQSLMEMEEAAPEYWLHSVQSSRASGQKPKTEIPEETLSLGSSSSSGSSLPDQGYAASEGMAEGEDSGMISSPSDTQPTSPDGSLSLDGSGRGRGKKLLGPVRDNSSDSDEGCATWGSRHRHGDISSQAKSDGLKDGYEHDPELTAQLHETLAEFEADLAEHIDIVSAKETPYTMSTDSNEVPVSVVDMDVPVTAIDEVLEDYEHNILENEKSSPIMAESSDCQGFRQQTGLEPQNKNNNACTAAGNNKSSSANTKHPSQPEQHRKSLESMSIGDVKEEEVLETTIEEMHFTDANSVKEGKRRPASAVKSNVDVQKKSRSTDIKPGPVKNNVRSFQEKQPVFPPTSQKSVSAEEEMHRVYQNNPSSHASYSKITHNVTTRFGMRTFTVIPPKHAVTHTATEKPAVTLSAGAIKIDDQGNMVKVDISCNKFDRSSEKGTNCSKESPLLGKAKAFWTSNERQESVVLHSKGLIDKAKDNTDGLKCIPTPVSETTATSNTENLKMTHSTLYKTTERAQCKDMVKEEVGKPGKDLQVAKEKQEKVETEKISVSKNMQPPRNKPSLPPPPLPEVKKDLPFLKPSRRTSSQYVASAITKYTPNLSAKPSSIPNVPDSSGSVKTQAVGFQRLGRTLQVNPHQSSQSSLSNNKSDSAPKPNPPGTERSVNCPEYVSDRQRNGEEVRSDTGGFESCTGSTKGSSNMLETEAAKNKHIKSSDHIRPRSSTPAQSSPLHSSAKPPTAPKTISKDQTSNMRDIITTATHLTLDVKSLPLVTMQESVVTPGPLPVTVFGPVKKFRPVICGSVKKETTLHSSLMEAIQTGGVRDKLKKISTSDASSIKKASYVEEVNERSALLSAIRAPSNSDRLRKTKSEAAVEVDRFKKAASAEERSAEPPLPPPLTSTPPVFSQPPPPPPPPSAPMLVPPPPVCPSANTPMNPALAREAMLEAIRSGSAAERLKKVTVPTKTIQVNGRLGRRQPTSLTLPQ
uniref:protein cordon-bleu isoform X2 n=1 Tax=Monopterus albus TaxID=43700 RepID=UPI0009B33320|nr:protein cordon-bleu isoform X2 [Monopterus albus]